MSRTRLPARSRSRLQAIGLSAAAAAAVVGISAAHTTHPAIQSASRSTTAAVATWGTMPSPDAGKDGNVLSGVAGASDTDEWAVGDYTATGHSEVQPLTEHWDGTTWSTVTAPGVAHTDSALYAVATLGSGGAWAVGGASDRTAGTSAPLAEHWDGTAWTVVPTPNPAVRNAGLTGVASVAGDDVWAVGSYDSGVGQAVQPLIEHWDGTAWSIATGAHLTTSGNILSAVVATSATDVWAVGHYWDGKKNDTLVEHFDGSRWQVSSPSNSPSQRDNSLWAVTSTSPSDVWAVGDQSIDGGEQPLVIHWDGTSWKNAQAPAQGSGGQLFGVAEISPTDVWAIGAAMTGIKYPDAVVHGPLLMHWDGTSWTTAPNTLTSGDSELRAVARTPSKLRAVGTNGSSTLIAKLPF